MPSGTATTALAMGAVLFLVGAPAGAGASFVNPGSLLCENGSDKQICKVGRSHLTYDARNPGIIATTYPNFWEERGLFADARGCTVGLAATTLDYRRSVGGQHDDLNPFVQTPKATLIANACTCNPGAATGVLGCDLEAGKTGSNIGQYYYCRDRRTYIDLAGGQSDYCLEYTEVTGWGDVSRDGRQANTRPKVKDCWGRWCSGKKCPDGYEERGGVCYDKNRYLFESCWDGEGKCAGEGVHQLSCKDATCVPGKLYSLALKECTCENTNWWAVLTGEKNPFTGKCTSTRCDGHACDYGNFYGNYGAGQYCDYTFSNNNW